MAQGINTLSRGARAGTLLSTLCKTPLGAISVVIVLAFFAVGITADFIAPYDPVKLDIRAKLQGRWGPPIEAHCLP